MRNKGFSLLELLVVIGVIAVLLAVAISSYSTTQKKARDSKRLSDLKTIQQAAEQYYAVCGFSYPNFASGATSEIVCLSPSQSILPEDKLPLDPKTNTAYSCPGSCTSSGFTLCATMEIGPTSCISNQQ